MYNNIILYIYYYYVWAHTHSTHENIFDRGVGSWRRQTRFTQTPAHQRRVRIMCKIKLILFYCVVLRSDFFILYHRRNDTLTEICLSYRSDGTILCQKSFLIVSYIWPLTRTRSSSVCALHFNLMCMVIILYLCIN